MGNDTMKKKKNAFESLEEKLNIASSIIEDLQEEEPLVEIENMNLPMEINSLDEEVFSLAMLKQDFMLVRQNLLGLVSKGQRLLDSCSVLDATELKASQIEAISNLSNSIANNLKIIVSTYKDIAEIEKNRGKFGPTDQIVQSVNTGTVNNIVFSGTTSDLMEIIKNNTI
jgi:hypothetical protein